MHLSDPKQELGTSDLEKQGVDVIRQLGKFGTEKLGDRTSTLPSAEGMFRSF